MYVQSSGTRYENLTCMFVCAAEINVVKYSNGFKSEAENDDETSNGDDGMLGGGYAVDKDGEGAGLLVYRLRSTTYDGVALTFQPHGSVRKKQDHSWGTKMFMLRSTASSYCIR